MDDLFFSTQSYELPLEPSPMTQLSVEDQEGEIQDPGAFETALPRLLSRILDGELEFIILRGEDGAFAQAAPGSLHSDTLILEWQHPQEGERRHFRFINRQVLDATEMSSIASYGLHDIRAHEFSLEDATAQLLCFLHTGKPKPGAYLFDVSQDLFGDASSPDHLTRELARYERVFDSLDIPNPQFWAQGVVLGQPLLLHVGMFLSQALKTCLLGPDPAAKARALAGEPDNNEPYDQLGSVIRSLEAKGMSHEDIAELLVEIRRDALKNFCGLIEGNPEPDTQDVQWAFFTVNAFGRPTKRLTAIKQSLDAFAL